MTTLYPYQETDINTLFGKINDSPVPQKLLYQLPTGGGKTVIFSEIARRFIEAYGKKIVILTHRRELCTQTSKTLKRLGIPNKVINSTVKKLRNNDSHLCYVAMVETLNNRIREGAMTTEEIGLVIIDEAHNNSFHKLLGEFPGAWIVGVTATPFSSDISTPLADTYDELIIGESIDNLINQGFLARPKVWTYDVELNTLKTGMHGDFTIATSDELYSSPAMLDLLTHAYQAHALNKKTLIFNNGIFTSKKVYETFSDLGFPIRHLDNATEPSERSDILQWFKRTKGAILTSVSILTTGFDEPSVQAVVLNRATTSITLYHQMIGRGSRRLPQKKTFSIIDLGNNTERFGEWNKPVDWKYVFQHPLEFQTHLHSTITDVHALPSELRSSFPNSLELSFDIQNAYKNAVDQHQKPKVVIRDAIRQHVLMCVNNSDSIPGALQLAKVLEPEIAWRVKQYGKCLGRVTKNYTDWLKSDYMDKLQTLITRLMKRRESLRVAG